MSDEAVRMTSSPGSAVPRRSRSVRVGLAAGVAGLGLLTLAGCALGDPDAEVSLSSTSTPESTPDSAATQTPSPSAPAYADGTYTADGSYQAPSGIEAISVRITLVDDVVTEAVATPAATDPQARVFQRNFSAGISAEAVGRDIADLSVSRVSGSSLTSLGFNAAVEQIRAEALL
jgi:uncharacterized protein with FMN-binding domain